MSLLLSALIGHVLSLIEAEIAREEPAAIAAIAKELEVLVARLESYIALKNPQIAAVANPAIEVVTHVAIDAMNAAGDVIEKSSASN